MFLKANKSITSGLMTIKENANKNSWNQHILKRTLVCSCLQSIKYQDLSSLSMKYRGGKGGFPCSSVGKEFACDAGDLGLIPGSGRSPGEGNGNPLQYSCLENPTDRGTWWATVYGVARVGHDWKSKHTWNIENATFIYFPLHI